MKNKRVCVFCGEKPAPLRSSEIVCGGTYQLCCIPCEEKLRQLNELEQCRRALRLGLASEPEKLEARIDVLTNAELHRHKCLRCGAAVTYGTVQHLDNTPLNDSVFHDSLDVVPAYCKSCGKIEFFHPEFFRKNKYLACLIELDSGE